MEALTLVDGEDLSRGQQKLVLKVRNHAQKVCAAKQHIEVFLYVKK